MSAYIPKKSLKGSTHTIHFDDLWEFEKKQLESTVSHGHLNEPVWALTSKAMHTMPVMKYNNNDLRILDS
jgi:hypothetical protein